RSTVPHDYNGAIRIDCDRSSPGSPENTDTTAPSDTVRAVAAKVSRVHNAVACWRKFRDEGVGRRTERISEWWLGLECASCDGKVGSCSATSHINVSGCIECYGVRSRDLMVRTAALRPRKQS